MTRAAVHELRTPLTAIHGYAQLLRRGLSNPAMAERALDIILRESARLSALLSQLSEVAELDSDSFALAPDQLDLLLVARSVAERASGEAGGRELEVIGDGPVPLRADPRRVTQVLTHVVRNAVNYTPNGGPVTIRPERQDGAAHVTVADSGIGVAEEDGERIYERYYRGRNVERAGVRGLGLGLSVAREVVTRCGGRIWHEPNRAGGTIFYVVWPDM